MLIKTYKLQKGGTQLFLLSVIYMIEYNVALYYEIAIPAISLPSLRLQRVDDIFGEDIGNDASVVKRNIHFISVKREYRLMRLRNRAAYRA